MNLQAESHGRKILDVKPAKTFTRAVTALHAVLQAVGPNPLIIQATTDAAGAYRCSGLPRNRDLYLSAEAPGVVGMTFSCCNSCRRSNINKYLKDKTRPYWYRRDIKLPDKNICLEENNDY